ncbi:winged helix-turn-helix domain-containing protein [Vibrio sp. ER1A]|uniref:winged helix-turn-helix domain-containing protein n=1 Tax=Vibrio sp. ER1A TaxID=1517681 RepID=UPI0009E06D29|nr:winged helix-turn-helix domain-containing protein [Vibrio sp. ER1A]
MAQQPISNETTALIIKYAKAGATQKEIANHLGVSQPTVSRTLKLSGVKRPKYDFSNI